MITAVILNWNTSEIAEESAKLLLNEADKVILVDNGSKVPPKRIKGVTHIYNTKNLGNCVARNQAIKKAKGDILLLDGDILYVKGTANLLQKELHGRIGCAGLCQTRCNELDKEHSDKECNKLTHGEYDKLFDTWHGKMSIAHTNYGLFKAEVFETCLFDETDYFGLPGYGWEDNDFYMQMKANDWHVISFGGVRHFHDRHSSMRFLDADNTPQYIEERYKQLKDKWNLEEKTINVLSVCQPEE